MILLELNPEKIALNICIPFIVGIFAFALPLILSVTRNIDEKYSSSKIMETFFKSWQVWSFIITLILALMSIIPFAICNNIIAFLYVLCGTTLLLVAATIIIIYLAYRYYVPEKLFKLLKNNNKYKKLKFLKFYNNILHRKIYWITIIILLLIFNIFLFNVYLTIIIYIFIYLSIFSILYLSVCYYDYNFNDYNSLSNRIKANNISLLSQLMIYAIRNTDDDLIDKIREYYRHVKKIYNEKEYKSEYYQAIYDMNENICKLSEEKSSYYYSLYVFDLLIMFRKAEKDISDKTYECLWRCIKRDVYYKKIQYIATMFENLYGDKQIHEDTIAIRKEHYNFNEVICICYDAMAYAIEINNQALINTIYVYYSTIPNAIKNEKNKYPNMYCRLILSINEELCKQNKLDINENYGSYAFNLLVQDNSSLYICESTYSYLWQCIIQDITYNKDKFILDFWYASYNYYIANSLLNEDDLTNTNKEKFNEEDFLDFYYALGGILMSQNKYDIIYKTLNLGLFDIISATLNDIIAIYPSINNFSHGLKAFNYTAPIEVTKQYTLSTWIKRYFALLFIYLYYSTNNNTTYDSLINSDDYKKATEELQKNIKDYLGKKEILEIFGLESLYHQADNNN